MDRRRFPSRRESTKRQIEVVKNANDDLYAHGGGANGGWRSVWASQFMAPLPDGEIPSLARCQDARGECEQEWVAGENMGKSSTCNKTLRHIKWRGMVSSNRNWLAEKVLAGERISPDEALELYRFRLEELGALANARRDLAKEKSYDGRGREIVTYIVDRNINYTNVCNVYCKFCAFYRTERMKIITCSRSNRSIRSSTNLQPRAASKS